ncbi:hypothetical protein ACIA78_34765 [Streptomyces xanthochromogenes]|uniref:hypothetical protein n=1 Tax=Streptomyces xanthochromogenes TaxID=67384 RepID=UPI00379BC22E
MFFRSLFLYVLLPGYGVWLAHAVWTAHRRTPASTSRQAAPFWLHYLKGCAGFPLLCLALISLALVWTGRIP